MKMYHTNAFDYRNNGITVLIPTTLAEVFIIYLSQYFLLFFFFLYFSKQELSGTFKNLYGIEAPQYFSCGFTLVFFVSIEYFAIFCVICVIF